MGECEADAANLYGRIGAKACSWVVWEEAPGKVDQRSN